MKGKPGISLDFFFVNSSPESKIEILTFFLKSYIYKDVLLLLIGVDLKVPHALHRSIKYQLLPRQHLGPRCPDMIKLQPVSTGVKEGEIRAGGLIPG